MLTMDGGEGDGIEGPFRRGDFIHRRTQPWTAGVHALLVALRTHGFANAPLSAGYDGMWEKVSFLPGLTGDLAECEAMRSETALRSAASLLRLYHDCTALFLPEMAARQEWQLSPRVPVEVICHGDFAPYNVVLNAGVVTGIIDFETAHPGPRGWDLAYALYRWAPLSTGIAAESLGGLDEQIRRARIFLDAYGFEAKRRPALPDMIIERLNALVGFMESEAARGVEKYGSDLRDGHDRIYRNDIGYISENRRAITAGLTE
ncbi:aminoglycoside phosphotransferase family protein [Rhizobium sp. ICMP 5592]|uniref:phosphotransferase n=1 Tax=Rhizobium sp. ICMP 5592 TaxID=2292445 RepID=UPI001295D353|nr:aminoglycoside phosphotransferase family protein [Rhizobium sp. ICMP 5592]MQB43988.1 aminoglycoside phosphotransferase family protein [Rhizobium sp. ICMP 5592]